jgi:hypothetical protein
VRRSIRVAALALGALGCGLVFAAAPTFAAYFHPAAPTTFAGSGVDALSAPEGVAVNDSTDTLVQPEAGDVYVVDKGNNRVERFSAGGTYLGQFNGSSAPTGVFSGPTWIAVDNSGKTAVEDPSVGDVYVVDGGHHVIDKFSEAGVYLGQITTGKGGVALGNVLGVAVDAQGLVWVNQESGEMNSESGEIDSYSDAATNAFVASVHDAFASFETMKPGFAVDSEDNLYVVTGQSYVAKTNSAGEALVEALEEEVSSAMAVDSSNNELYIDNVTSIGAFNPSGVQLERFGAGDLTSGSGVAINAATGTVYVTDGAANDVDVFTAATFAEATTEAASAVDDTAATINGTVNPDGVAVTACEFEYGTEPGAYSHAEPCSQSPAQINSASPPVAVSAQPSGLSALTTYYYRLVVTNGQGTNHTQQESFTTPGVPRVESIVSEVDSTEKPGQTEATLKAKIDPDGRGTTYSFEYGETTSYGTSVPLPPEAIGEGEAPVTRRAELSGLKLGTTYHYRVVASNEYGSVTSADQTFTTVAAAVIEDSSATEVTDDSATLDAHVIPLGVETTCEFQYVTEAGFQASAYAGSTSVPCPGSLGDGEETPVPTSVSVQGLTPGTVYHFRLVTNNTSSETAYGPDQTFTTQFTGAEFTLLDNREWEMVSPVDKHGARIEPILQEGGVAQSAEDGSAFTYVADAPPVANPEGNPAIVESQIISTRGSNGWSTRDIATPHEVAIGAPPLGTYAEYDFFAPDLSSGVIERHFSEETPLSPAASEPTLYLREGLREDGEAKYVPLVNDSNDTAGTHYAHKLEYGGASSNLEHIVLSSTVALTKSPEGVVQGPEGAGFYEWTKSTGELQPIGILPDGVETGNTSEGGQISFGEEGGKNVRGAISSNGQRVFWEYKSSSTQIKHIYAREVAEERTVQLDLAQGVKLSKAEEQINEPEFQYATPDGARVYFTDDRRLTPGATAEREKAELYEYDFERPVGDRLVDLTSNPKGTTSTDLPENSTVQVSENGEYVYFTASGSLDGAPESSCANRSFSDKACDLYVAHIEEPSKEPKITTSLVAVLSDEDLPDWASHSASKGELIKITSRVSPNGEYFAFMSDHSLTGYDNTDAVSGAADEEVYLYDAVTKRLVCASCDPTGARPYGIEDKVEERGEGEGLLVDRPGIWGNRYEGRWLAGSIPGWTGFSVSEAQYQSRYLSDEGRLFFDSVDGLVPQDTNGKEDVYEYEPAGLGPEGARCGSGSGSASVAFKPERSFTVEGREVDEGPGCVGLISSGTSGEESAFLDASGKGPGGEEGEDAFFLTSAKLSPQDIDSADDMYDAHVCSAQAPCAGTAVVSPPCTTADSCRVAPAVQPSIFGSPASATFSGAGNVAPAPSSSVAKSKSLTKEQKLTAALKTCKRDRAKGRRESCEKQARKRYGTKAKAKAKAKKSSTREGR